MKKLLSILLALVMLASLAACGGEQTAPADGENTETVTEPAAEETAEPTVVNVAALKGPTGIGIAKLASDAKDSGAYNVSFAGAPDEISGKLVTGELDAACVPTNLASVLYNKTEGKIRVAAVTTLGVLYIIDADGQVGGVADLAGKKLYATGQGSNPEYILNFILDKNGLKPGEDVEIEYVEEHSALAAMVISGDAKLAMLPVPFATQVEGKLEGESVIDLQAEWEKAADAKVAQGVLVVRADFAEQHPEETAALINDFAASCAFANENVADTAALVAGLEIIASEDTAKAAIPMANIVFLEGDEMKKTVSDFLNVLFDSDPKSVGGKLPGDDFYFYK